MASFVWAASTAGNYSTGSNWKVGGIVQSNPPTISDDVFFGSGTGATNSNCTVDVSSIARNFDCTGYTGTLTLNALFQIVPTAGGTVKFVSGMTLTGNGNNLAIISQVGANSSFYSGGKTMPGPLNFNNQNGGGVTLMDNLTVTQAVTLIQGTLNTNGMTCSFGQMLCTGSSNRALDITNSNITLTANSGAWDMTTATNLTFTSTGSTITVTAARFTIRGVTGSPNTVVFNNIVYSSTVTSCNLFYCKAANVTYTGGAVKTSGISWTEVTITGTLTLTGNSTTNRINMFTGHALGSQATVTAGAISLSNVDFSDIEAAGAAIPWTGTSLGDAQGNSNITFDTPVTQTWNGNTTGDWDNAANWTSRVPLPQDNVIINGLTSGTITANMPRLGADITLTGSTGGTITNSLAVTSYGNLTLPVGGTTAFFIISTPFGYTLSGRSSQTITSNGHFIQANLITIQAPGGTYTLQDDATFIRGLVITAGTFDANNYNVTNSPGLYLNGVISSGSIARTINMGSGTWTLGNTNTAAVWNMSGTNLTINPGTSTIIISDNGANVKTFAGGGYTYNNLTITGGSATPISITGSNTFNALTITNPNTVVTFANSTTNTVATFNATGSPGKLMTINSDSAGVAATLSKASGNVVCDYLSLQDSSATGGATWFAGTNSTNVSGNSGWIFNAFPVAPLGDTLTTSESVGYYSETIFTREQVKIFITSNLAASDSITFSENLRRNPISSIGVSDSISLSENFQNSGVPDPGVNDTIHLSENVSVVLVDIEGVNDTIHLSESTTVRLEGELQTSDSLTITERFNKLLFTPAYPIFITLTGKSLSTTLVAQSPDITLAGSQDVLNITLTALSLSATISGRPSSVTLAGRPMSVTLKGQ